MQKYLLGATIVLMASMIWQTQAATAYERPVRRPAIVLAAFGTTDVDAVRSILNIRDRVRAAFPDYDVHLAFTSNIIRSIWHKRANDAAFRNANPNVPAEVYCITNALSTLAAVQENGARPVLVQSLHVTDGEEYADLANLVEALSAYKTVKPVLHPFPWIAVGQPALGVGDGAAPALERAAEAIRPLADQAKASGSALVLMGHGNEHLNQTVFAKFEQILRGKFGPHVYVGTVEAEPLAEDIAKAMRADNAPAKVLLAPLMVVAGDHAKNDMAGEEEDSWASIFSAEGFGVTCHLQGLGSNDSWADIYVEHLRAIESAVVAAKQAQEAEENAKAAAE